MKHTYYVDVPIVARANVSVDAESEEEAIRMALEEVTLDDIEEWEAHKVIVEGNFYHGNINEVRVEDAGEADD